MFAKNYFIIICIHILMKLISTYLLLAMFLTMFLLYLFYPEPEVVIKYPNPESEVSDVYVDENNVCYRYHRNEVTI